MSRRIKDTISTQFSITLSEDLSHYIRLYASENGLILSTVFEKRMREWMEEAKRKDSGKLRR